MAKQYRPRHTQKQRDVTHAHTPPTEADMAKYYEMLKNAKNSKEDTEANTDPVGKTAG